MSVERIFGFVAFQQAILAWPEEPVPGPDLHYSEPLLERLHQILCEASRAGKIASDADFITLVRHLLLTERGNTKRLTVPSNACWPSATTWRKFNFRVTKSAKYFRVRPIEWNPEWLDVDGERLEDIFAMEHAGDLVRQGAEVGMDPFLVEASGHEEYVCVGQREAVRSALLMPPGSTLIVNLPTGAGKSLVGQAPTLLHGLQRGLSLFVVPTTALILDLAKRTRELLQKRYNDREVPEMAWFSGRSDEVKSEIKRRIRQSQQGILFASPEAVTGALLPSLYHAAHQGSLRYLVVDEAHLVAQWGDGFRPAFQALSGVRRGLLRSCAGEAFRTVLMSATFSHRTIETLDALFGPKDSIQMVSSVHLRPEPRYFSYRANGWEDKRLRVLELLRHAPRPFILYVTERQHAVTWKKILNDEGYARVSCFHGNTPNNTREDIIDKWSRNEIDGVVATSAFGVGMDKQDVRTVVHAAVPESLDRYYQEVGRGGRDGRACISVVIYTDRDEGIARGMKPKVIGHDKAYERWISMIGGADRVNDDDLYLLDLTVPPSSLQQQSDYNDDWNMRTLILMARAGMIELESIEPKPTARNPEETDKAYNERVDAEWSAYYGSIPIRTIDPRHRQQEHFEARLGRERTRGEQSAERSMNSLMSALRGEREMSEVLSDILTVHEPDRTVTVARACRGCPAEVVNRRFGVASYQNPPGIGIEKIEEPNITLWRTRFPWLDTSPVVVLCANEVAAIGRPVAMALRSLVSMFGIREVSATREQWKESDVLRNLHNSCQDRMLIARTLEEDRDIGSELPVPRVSLLLPWADSPIPDHLLILQRPLHVIFAPENVKDGNHPLRLFRDTNINHIGLGAFLDGVTQ